jgi:hypothetical protein
MAIKSNFDKCKDEFNDPCLDPAFPAPSKIWMDDLEDADTTTFVPAYGARLYWNNTNWVPDLSNDPNWELPPGIQGQFRVIAVESPYTLTANDNNVWLVFNTSDHAVVLVPDGFVMSHMFMTSNIGGGNLSFEPIGTDTVRGAKIITDVLSMLSLTKVSNVLWQSSERLPGGPDWTGG